MQEQLTNVNMAMVRRQMQRIVTKPDSRELKRSSPNNNSLCIFKNMLRVAFLLVSGIHISFGLQEQLTNFNVAINNRPMQRSLIIAEIKALQRANQNTHSEHVFANMCYW
jgi:hypothetical protein